MNESNADNHDCVVYQFEVMLQIEEYTWEMACGPYKTFDDAERAMLNWFRKDDIPKMRVVQFMTNKKEVIK